MDADLRFPSGKRHPRYLRTVLMRSAHDSASKGLLARRPNGSKLTCADPHASRVALARGKLRVRVGCSDELGRAKFNKQALRRGRSGTLTKSSVMRYHQIHPKWASTTVMLHAPSVLHFKVEVKPHGYSDGFSARILAQRAVRSSAVVSSMRDATVHTWPWGSMNQASRSPQNWS